jgi:structural maintenance of chromosome 1
LVQLQETVRRLQTDLAETKQKLDNHQAEQAKNEFVASFHRVDVLANIILRQLEKELNEKLQDVYNKMLAAGVDQRESERETRLKETLNNLKRIFPGVRGRVVDLCQPTARKYETAVLVVLGRNIDAVVVDEERTAIECIEVFAAQYRFRLSESKKVPVYAKPTGRTSYIHTPGHNSSEADQ